jgi:hypothetical protein
MNPAEPSAADQPDACLGQPAVRELTYSESQLGEDRVGGLGPDEWLGVPVVLVNVVVDRGLEVDDRMEAARLEPAPGSWLRR